MTTRAWNLGLWSFTALLALMSLLGGGCYSQLNGYEVVHSDMEVEYEAGPIGFAGPGASTVTTGGEAAATEPAATEREPGFDAAFTRAMEERLRVAASHFTLVGPSESPPHTLRVDRIEVAEMESGTNVRGEVSIVDRRGRVTTQLRIDVRVPERGEAAAGAAGDVFGARVAHYIENRENFHW